MSHFICDKCGAECIDSPRGYIRGCEHYPAEIQTGEKIMNELVPEKFLKAYIIKDTEDNKLVFFVAVKYTEKEKGMHCTSFYSTGCLASAKGLVMLLNQLGDSSEVKICEPMTDFVKTESQEDD